MGIHRHLFEETLDSTVKNAGGDLEGEIGPAVRNAKAFHTLLIEEFISADCSDDECGHPKWMSDWNLGYKLGGTDVHIACSIKDWGMWIKFFIDGTVESSCSPKRDGVGEDTYEKSQHLFPDHLKAVLRNDFNLHASPA